MWSLSLTFWQGYWPLLTMSSPPSETLLYWGGHNLPLPLMTITLYFPRSRGNGLSVEWTDPVNSISPRYWGHSEWGSGTLCFVGPDTGNDIVMMGYHIVGCFQRCIELGLIWKSVSWSAWCVLYCVFRGLIWGIIGCWRLLNQMLWVMFTSQLQGHSRRCNIVFYWKCWQTLRGIFKFQLSVYVLIQSGPGINK